MAVNAAPARAAVNEPKGTNMTTTELADERVGPLASVEDAAEKTGGAVRHGTSMWPLVATLAIVVAVGGMAGWLGYRAYQSDQEARQCEAFVAVARQQAVNLTTISDTEIDADIKRILDASSGHFRDDFQKRSPAFIDAVRQAHAKSTGDVTAAGIETMSADQADVLVAVSVKTSNAGAPEQEPRSWRMRISVSKVDDAAKVTNVEFVP
jgi:Mce-associated membrane protein